jgi:hypothetical protein
MPGCSGGFSFRTALMPPPVRRRHTSDEHDPDRRAPFTMPSSMRMPTLPSVDTRSIHTW